MAPANDPVAVTVLEAREALETFLADASGADSARIEGMERLPGGTLQEHWHLEVVFRGGSEAGRHRLVLRANRADSVPSSLSRPEELRVISAVRAAGVAVPEPLWASAGDGPLGREFLIMRFLPGTAAAHRIVRDEALGGPRERLVERLGEEIAKVQSIVPGEGRVEFLHLPEQGAAVTFVAEARRYLDSHPDPHPVVEWGLRWAELNAPPAGPLVLRHGDFRTGNYLVDEAGLVGILDWELASWGDPLEDLGWFCAKTWRFGRAGREAGGLAGRDALYRGYERITGRPVNREEARFWEIMANLRWALVSMQQAWRHLSGREPSLQLALTGRMTAESELEVLNLIHGGYGGAG